MSTENNAERLSVTLKGGKDYDAPWVVLKGGSTEDVAAELAKLDTDPALLDLAARVATAFQGAYVRAKSGQGNVQAAPQQPPAPAWVGDVPQQQPTSQPTSQGETFKGVVLGALHPQGQKCKKCGKDLVGRKEMSKKNTLYGAYICPDGPGYGHDLAFPSR